jgi:hypothetical protein
MVSQSDPACASTCGAGTACDAGNYCDATNHCSPTGDPGSACTNPIMCDTGLSCTDDVCCNSSCTGLCRACDLMGTGGACTMVGNGDDWDNECGTIDCDSYFHGWGGANNDRCFTRADVPADQADCNGSGACRTASQDCPGQGPGVVQIDCNDTCQAKSAGTCTGTTPGACTNLDLGDTTCGVGECQRTVANCNNGSPQTCQPGNPTGEACDFQDDDCDGLVDENFWGDPSWGPDFPNGWSTQIPIMAYYPNNGSGSIVGGILPVGDNDWFTVQATENVSDFCLTDSQDEPIKGAVTVAVPGGANYQVCYCFSSATALCGRSGQICRTASGGTSQSVQINSSMNCGSTDLVYLDILVRANPSTPGSASCSDYTVNWSVWE